MSLALEGYLGRITSHRLQEPYFSHDFLAALPVPLILGPVRNRRDLQYLSCAVIATDIVAVLHDFNRTLFASESAVIGV